MGASGLRIHPFIHALHLPVNLGEFCKALVIQGPVLLLRCVGALELHQSRYICERDLAQADRPDPGGTAGVGINGIGNLPNLHIQHISEDLAPDIRLGSAADDVDGRYFASEELLHGSEQPAGVEGNPFQEGADNILPGVV